MTIDTLRADHVGAFGGRAAATPAIDAIAAEAVRFTAAETAVPLTLPSHTTILTGLLPQHHGVRNNGSGALGAAPATLAATLGAAGYRTGAFVGSFVLDHRFGLSRGFEKYDDDIARDASQSTVLEAERPAAAVADRALQWLGTNDARPFFAWIHFYDAHAPYAPPEPYRTRRANDLYSGEIEYVDAQVARVVEQLRASHALDDTIVVIAGDHGEALGEHGEATHGLLLYEPTTHVPLVIRVPGARPHAVATPVSLVDLAPTIAALAGTSLAGHIDGRDLSGALRDAAEPAPADLYLETFYPANFGWSPLKAVRRGSMKYIGGPGPELYDVVRDPNETRNVRTEERRSTAALTQALANYGTGEVTSGGAVDDETRRKLASLGYVSGPVGSAGSHADPKAMAPLFRRFELAIFAQHDGRVDEAAAELHRLVDADPANPVFRATLARLQKRAGDLRGAIENYKAVVAASPGDADAWYNLATALQEAGATSEAGKVIAESLRLDPRRADAHNTNGIILFDEHQPDQAIAEFRRAAELDPRDARAYNNLGNVHRAQGNVAAAEAAYRSAIAIAPGYADALNGLGTILVGRDQPREGLTMFDRALAAQPGFVEAALNRGIALQLLGDRAAAAAAYEGVLKSTAGQPRMAAQRRAAAELLSRLPGRADRVPSTR